MQNPYLTFVDRGKMRQALLVAAGLSNDELSQHAGALTEAQSEKFKSVCFNKLNNLCVDAALCGGGMLHLRLRLAEKQDRTEEFHEFLLEQAISETKGYDWIRVFCCFGMQLLPRLELASQFPLESLKRLSASSASPKAREAALALASQGTRVTIKLAEELLYKFAEVYEPGEEQAHPEKPRGAKTRHRVSASRKRTRGKPIWSHPGEVVNIVIEAPTELVNSDPESVIRDLEAAIVHYKEAFELSDAEPADDGSPRAEPTDSGVADDQADTTDDSDEPVDPDYPDAA